MLDWPEQSHTSPTKMFLASMVELPLKVMLVGLALAGTGSSVIVHLPSFPALAVLVCPAKATVTSVPGVSQPQSGFAFCCWSTMLSPMMAGSLSSATAAEARARRAVRGR